MIPNIINRVHQVIFPVLKPSQPGVATITNKSAYSTGMMVMVRDNLGGYSNNGSLPAKRAQKRIALLGFLSFHLFGLFGFGSAFVNGSSAFLTGWPSDYAMQVVLVFGKVFCRFEAVADIANFKIKLIAGLCYINFLYIRFGNDPVSIAANQPN
jgi:hypothetical protein